MKNICKIFKCVLLLFGWYVSLNLNYLYCTALLVYKVNIIYSIEVEYVLPPTTAVTRHTRSSTSANIFCLFRYNTLGHFLKLCEKAYSLK